MLCVVPKLTPVLTSDSGLSLTTANWQEAHVKAASFYLDALLLKPGYEQLKNISDIARYLNWPETLILNASTMRANKEGIFTLKSSFDGSTIKLAYRDLVDLMVHLRPDRVILPLKISRDYPDIWQSWDDAIIPYIAFEDYIPDELNRVFGVYLHVDDCDEATLDRFNKCSHLPRYIKGRISLDSLERFSSEGIEFIETDEPAQLAMQGIVYGRTGTFSLKDESVQMDFDPINTDCICPTCSARLSKAYLHHLYLHTPLLAQRFLIQHNIYTLDTSKCAVLGD